MPAAPPRIVLIHGFTQTGASWRPVIEALRRHLGADAAIDAVDVAGHGTAGALRLGLRDDAARIASAIVQSGGPAIVVGYSMGGRLALRLALDHPAAVAGVVLVGATAGIDDPDERAARRRADEDLARRIEADGVDGFLDTWLAQPLFTGLRVTRDDLAARRTNTAEGLAASLRLAGTGTMDPPWWDELHRIDVPAYVVWGEDDHKFAALGQRLADGIGPNAETTSFVDVGHAAHLEAPDAFGALVAGWSQRVLRG